MTVPQDSSLDQSFTKNVRLLTSADYSHVFGDAKAVSDAAFTVLCRPNELGYPRLGLAISKKMLRRAVDRNRVKRLVRESFRMHKQELQGRDFVVLARRGLKADQRDRIRQSIDHLWTRSIKRCAVSVSSHASDQAAEQTTN